MHSPLPRSNNCLYQRANCGVWTCLLGRHLMRLNRNELYTWAWLDRWMRICMKLHYVDQLHPRIVSSSEPYVTFHLSLLVDPHSQIGPVTEGSVSFFPKVSKLLLASKWSEKLVYSPSFLPWLCWSGPSRVGVTISVAARTNLLTGWCLPTSWSVCQINR